MIHHIGNNKISDVYEKSTSTLRLHSTDTLSNAQIRQICAAAGYQFDNLLQTTNARMGTKYPQYHARGQLYVTRVKVTIRVTKTVNTHVAKVAAMEIVTPQIVAPKMVAVELTAVELTAAERIAYHINELILLTGLKVQLV